MDIADGILIGSNIVFIAGAYWKVRMMIAGRPTYEKVEQMIERDTVSEERVEHIVDRNAYPKSNGELLSGKIDHIEKLVTRIDEKLDKHILKNNLK